MMTVPADCLQKVRTKASIHLPSEFLAPNRLREGIQRRLNDRLLRYVEELSGVILSYDSLALTQPLGRLHNETPYVHFNIVFDAIVFAPREGMQIAGEVNQIGRDYVGLLVLGVFNAAVPMAEVPPELQRRISVGTRLLMELTGIHVAHDRLSLSGSLLSPGTRIIPSTTDTPKKNKRKESLGGGASEVAFTPSVKQEAPTPQTEEKHKKKKAKKDKHKAEVEA